jgi:hypothetical protein
MGQNPQKGHRPGGGPKCGDYGHRNKRGDLCGQYAVRGTKHCVNHAGKPLAKLRAEGEIVLAARKWGPGDTKVDPGEVLLRLLTQSLWRVEELSGEIERIVGESGSLVEALTANSYTATIDGSVVKTGEYIRAMTELEGEERDRCFSFAAKAVAAGLAERQVRIAERQVEYVKAAIEATLAEMGMNPAQQREAIRRVGGHLRVAAS